MKSKKFTTILLVVQLILSIVITTLIFKLNILPTKYLALFVLIVFIIIGLFALANRRLKQGKASRLLLDVAIMIINISLLMGNYYFYRSYRALEQLTAGSNVQTHTLNMRVLDESEVLELEDLTGKVVEYSNQTTTEYNGQYVEQLQKEYDFDFQEVTTYQQLVDDLYNGNCDAIILDEAYEGFLEVLHSNYQNETRVIDTYEFQEQIEEPEVVEEEPVQVEEEDGNSFSVFISGIDTSGSINTVSRSDVNMVMTVNTKTHEILLTSIPRDYYVTLHSFGVKDKFTHSGVYGINETITTAEDFLDIDIDYYVRVNFTSLIKIIDALGGISIYNSIAFSNRGYSYPVGQIEMNGAKALVYARERYAYTNGDNQRIKNQQTILTGILNKAMSPAILTNYTSLLDVVMKSCQTNIPTDVVTSLVKEQLNNNESWNIEHQYLSGSGSHSTKTYSMPGYNLYVMIPNQASIDAASANIEIVEDGGTPNL